MSLKEYTMSFAHIEFRHDFSWLGPYKNYNNSQVYISNIFERKYVNIFLPISRNISYVVGAQKNRLIETVLFSTHNICFSCEIRKLYFGTHS